MKVPFLWLGVLPISMAMAYGQTAGTPPAKAERPPAPARAASAIKDVRLVDAVRSQDQQRVRTLLPQHVDVNVRAEDGAALGRILG